MVARFSKNQKRANLTQLNKYHGYVIVRDDVPKNCLTTIFTQSYVISPSFFSLQKQQSTMSEPVSFSTEQQSNNVLAPCRSSKRTTSTKMIPDIKKQQKEARTAMLDQAV
jgi:hypothetical protein